LLDKILVTGGAGYIGSHAIVKLLNSRHEVICFDNLSNSNRKSLDRVQQITGRKIDFIQGDLLDKEAVNKLFQNNRIKSVIHFGGLKAVGESTLDPLKYFQNNCVGTINLLNIMSNFGVYKFIFSSSATVYGDSSKTLIDEKSPLHALNPYGHSKLIVENILKDLCQSDSKWHIGILRYFNPLGAHQSGLIGEDPRGVPNNLLPYIMGVALGKYDYLSVFGDDYPTHDGTGVRDYIHITDLIDGHIKALDFLENHSGLNIWNLGSGCGYSVLQMIHIVELVTGKNIKYKFVDRRPGDVATCLADIHKAKKELNWEPNLGLESMVSDAWNWQTKNPLGYSV
jgi:UDP-glucose 4-epimerase